MKYRDDRQQHNYDDVFDFNKDSVSSPQQTQSTPPYTSFSNKNTSDIDRLITGCSLFIIVACMLLWSGSIIATTVINGGDTGDIVTTVASQILFWFVTWVVYYLGWKYYWIVIAIGWLLITFYTLFILNNAPNVQIFVM
jgi:hypothetical protein